MVKFGTFVLVFSSVYYGTCLYQRKYAIPIYTIPIYVATQNKASVQTRHI